MWTVKLDLQQEAVFFMANITSSHKDFGKKPKLAYQCKIHCRCTLPMVFQHAGLCPASKLTIFQEVNLSRFCTVCRWLLCVSALWGSCPGSVPVLGDEAARAVAHLSSGSSHPWAVSRSPLQPYLPSLRPARSKSTKPELERKWGSSSRAAWLCAGFSTGLAAHRTGKTVRSRQAPAACLHYRLKAADRTFSQTVQTPAGEEYHEGSTSV